ncbi:MAG: hypothetical protein NZ869_00950 [Thermoanaerobaculum sp.]|nr:hypothetical protein [Thermoanaerobaculum sp.]MDW7966844.1 hypothetical protein [Thermoanaerobaculum sp.]
MLEVGIWVPNLFHFAVVEAAVRACGATPRRLSGGEGPLPQVVVVDLEAVDPEAVLALTHQGVQVLAFGPHGESSSWARLRQAGVVVLAKSTFFRDLPALLEVYLNP